MTETETKPNPNAPAPIKKSHFGSRAHRISQLDLLLGRINKAAAVFAGTGVANMLEEAAEAVADAKTEAGNLPEDWRPAGRPVVHKAKVELKEGDRVEVKAKKQADYADLLTPAEMTDLVIIKIAGKKARCGTSTASTAVIPLSQLAVAKAA
jgi:hypothetical protein